MSICMNVGVEIRCETVVSISIRAVVGRCTAALAPCPRNKTYDGEKT